MGFYQQHLIRNVFCCKIWCKADVSSVKHLALRADFSEEGLKLETVALHQANLTEKNIISSSVDQTSQ